jgi:Zn-dependent protease
MGYNIVMNLDPLSLAAVFFALVVGLVLHEFMHAYVGHRLGDDTAHAQGRITLNPMAHIDPFTTLLLPFFLLLAGLPVFAAAKPVPFNPWALRGGKWGAAAVAAAGPLTNLVIAVICGLWLHLVTPSALSYVILGSMVVVNVGLFVFNSIPLPPLDGSRVLYAIVPPSAREVMDRIEHAGLIVIFGFVLLMSYTPLGPLLGHLITGITALLLPASPLGI